MSDVLDRLIPLLDEETVQLPTVSQLLEQLATATLKVTEIADEDWLRIPVDQRPGLLLVWSAFMKKQATVVVSE